MKKILLASTALAIGGAVSAASVANAAEPLTASVNGYMHAGLSFTDNDDQDGVGVLRDGEIHFNANGSSDNGLTFGVHIELEAFTSDSYCTDVSGGGNISADECFNGDQIDENYITVGGSFGQIKIGGDDSAKNAYVNGVLYSPGAHIGYYDGFGYLGGVQPGISGASDSIGIHYDSPNFNGFQFGATYQPSTSTDGPMDANVPVYEVEDCDDCGNNTWSVGAVYENDFEGFGFGIGAGYLTSDDDDSDTWHVGGNVSASGFTLAVQFEENPGAADTNELGIGLGYVTGPWTIRGGWAQIDGDGADPQVFSGWVTYAMAPGVNATVGFEYGDPDTDEDEQLGGMAYLSLSF